MAGIGHWYIEMEKQGYWRGAQHTWVNRYVMSGVDPNAAGAISAIGAIHDIENQLHAQIAANFGDGFVQGRAYSGSGGAPFAEVNYNIAKTPGTATGFQGAQWASNTQTKSNTLEVCQLLETALTGLSSKGKPIYLRKYYRGVMYGQNEGDSSTGIPSVDLAGIAAVTVPFQTGLGTGNWVVIGVSGKQASGPPRSAPYMVNHQIPRGRKKKKSSGGDILSSLINDASRLSSVIGALE